MFRVSVLSCLWLIAALSAAYGQYAKIFPASAEVVDVTKPPYNAIPDDALDDLAAIQQAIDDHPNGHHIIYLPKGTYYLSDTLKWAAAATSETSWRYTILQGYHRDSTILRLYNNASGYGNPSQRRPMIWTGEGAAQRFRNAVRDLTLHTGTGNPGAVGLQFKASNQGGIFDVSVISGDGQGVTGIDFTYSDIPGPLLIKNVLIDGFDYGIRTNYNANSITVEYLTLRNQRVYGILNNQQRITVRKLLADSLEVPAFFNANDGGTYATLTDSEIRGKGAAASQSAIINYRHLYANNVTVTGYERSINQLTFGLTAQVENAYVDEFISHPVDRVCYNVETTLGLPVEETPVFAWEDTANWVSVTEYGATYGPPFGTDDTDSIQAAFNSGASTIVFPAPGPFPRSFTLTDTLDIPAGVTHIIGAESRMSGGVVRILGGSDTLVVERFDKFGDEVLHHSGRVVIFKNMTVRGYRAASDGSAGDVFLEDVQGDPWYFKDQNVWARQFNTEAEGLNVTNDGSNLWILGYKTEKKGVLIKTINGGKTEVIGAFVYTNKDTPGGTMFEVEDGSLSVAGLKELVQGSNIAFETVVEDIRQGDTTRLSHADGWNGALVVAYPAAGPNVAPTVEAGLDQTLTWPSDTSTVLSAQVNDDGLPGPTCGDVSLRWRKLSGGEVIFADSTSHSTAVTFTFPGVYVFEFSADDGALTSRDTVRVRVFEQAISTLDHDDDGIPSGQGADAYGQSGGAFLNNYGGSSSVQVRFSGTAGTARKGLIRFDLSALETKVDAAQLELDISTTNVGLIEAWTYNVFGLKDGHPGEAWLEGEKDGTPADSGEVYYDIIPGTTFQSRGGVFDSTKTVSAGVIVDQVDFLGTFTLRPGVQETVTFTSDKLAQFLNDDTDDLVSFILTRVDNSNNTVNFASKENLSYQPPTLRVVRDTTPIINQPPLIAGLTDASLQWPQDSLQLSAQVTDDGLPSNTLTYQWSQMTGEPVTFSDPQALTTDVAFSHPGVYELLFTASDGALSSIDTVTVRVFGLAISTAEGQGADAYGQSGGAFLNNYGASTGVQVRFSGTAGTARKGILRFDLSSLDKEVAEAQLELDISTTNTGLIEAWTYNVFGLKDGHAGEAWGEGNKDGTPADSGEVYYDIIPGTTFQSRGGAFDSTQTISAGVVVDQVEFLGTFTLRAGVQETIVFGSEALVDFLNRDTDSLVSIILTRVDNSVNTVVFASKENSTYQAPTLRIVPIQTCDNTPGLAACDDDHDGIPNSLDHYPTDSLNNGLGAILAYSWDDLNGNSLQDVDEPPVSGIRVDLVDNDHTQVYDSAYTNADGLVAFFTPLYTSRKLFYHLPPNHDFTAKQAGGGSFGSIDSDVNATTNRGLMSFHVFTDSGQVEFDRDAGIRSPGTIISRVWIDANDNGLQDSAEVGLAGVTVELQDKNDNVLATAQTNALGEVVFESLFPWQNYLLYVYKPAGYSFARYDVGNDDELDSDVLSSGKTESYWIRKGAEVVTKRDIGLVPDSVTARRAAPREAVAVVPTLKLFPNPTQSALFVETQGLEVHHYELYDRLGRRLQTFTTSKLSVAHLAEGLYVIRVIGVAGEVLSQTFIRSQ